MTTTSTLTPTPQLETTCPRCAEEIAATADTCPYCDARLAVTSRGYCPSCRQVSTADTAGSCRTCGTALVDVQVDSEPAAPSAPAPALPVPAVAPGEPTGFTLKVRAKMSRKRAGLWHGPVELAVAGGNVALTGVYLDREAAARERRLMLFWQSLLLAGVAMMLGGRVLIASSATASVVANVGVGLILAALVLTVVVSRRRKGLERNPRRAYAFPASQVTFLKLERYGSQGLLVFLIVFGGILPGYLLWRFAFAHRRQVRITAPFDPDAPEAPETYRLVAGSKDEAAALAQALLPRTAG